MAFKNSFVSVVLYMSIKTPISYQPHPINRPLSKCVLHSKLYLGKYMVMFIIIREESLQTYC